MEKKTILDTGRTATRSYAKSGSKAVYALKTVGNGVKGLLGIQGSSSDGEKVPSSALIAHSPAESGSSDLSHIT